MVPHLSSTLHISLSPFNERNLIVSFLFYKKILLSLSLSPCFLSSSPQHNPSMSSKLTLPCLLSPSLVQYRPTIADSRRVPGHAATIVSRWPEAYAGRLSLSLFFFLSFYFSLILSRFSLLAAQVEPHWPGATDIFAPRLCCATIPLPPSLSHCTLIFVSFFFFSYLIRFNPFATRPEPKPATFV